MAMIKGEKIELGGGEFTLPPMPLAIVDTEEFGTLMAGCENPVADKIYRESLTFVLHESLKRNYPEITREFVGVNLDMRNIREIPAALLRANGLSAASEGDSQGEAQASQ